MLSPENTLTLRFFAMAVPMLDDMDVLYVYEVIDSEERVLGYVTLTVMVLDA